jgi:hypothetical protein
VANDRRTLLVSLAEGIADYRLEELGKPSSEHVDRWVSQFGEGIQDEILKEMDHVLKKTYVSRPRVDHFLKELSKLETLTGSSPKQFWKDTQLLDIQQAGSSQHELLDIFDKILQREFKIGIHDCSSSAARAMYLDDAVFSGGHVRNDITKWILNSAPNDVELHIIVLAYHMGGEYFASKKIREAARACEKRVNLKWWRIFQVEDRRYLINDSDVLRPVRIPDHEPSREYADMLGGQGYPPLLRKPGNVGPGQFFSSEPGRNVLEQEFLKAGTEIRNKCPNLNEYQRPLGNSVLKTLGFGAMTVTFRNCANNCPLALWAGDPWHPLFQRKTN